MKLSSFVMLYSQDAKLSSWAAAELSLMVVTMELTLVVAAAMELAAVVVAARQVIAVVVGATQVTTIVVAMTQVAAVVVAATEVAAVVVTSLNWKIYSLPRQTQCPTYTIGRDNQRSFHVSIHYSLEGIPACFYGGHKYYSIFIWYWMRIEESPFNERSGQPICQCPWNT
jgi:hypothetical protein